jgi:malate dehydrogenase (oxaloacetate-decarboxylating)(NADP+)
MMKIAPAVAKAAADSGVALRPIADLDAYREKLQTFVYASGTTMKPIFTLAKRGAEEARRLCRGRGGAGAARVQVVVDENLARPTLIGRPDVIAQRCEKFGLRLKEGKDYDLVNTERDHRYRDYWQTYHQMTARKGVTAQLAKIEMRRRLTLIAAMMLHKGEVDGMLCGTWGSTGLHLRYIDQVIGLREGAKTYACMNGLILPGPADPARRHPCQLRPDGRADRRDHRHGAEEMMRFGLIPRPPCCRTATSVERPAVGGQDAPGAGDPPEHGALARGRRRDARRHRARRGLPQGADARQRPDRRGQPAGAAQHRRGQHSYNLLKTAAGGGIAIGPVLLGAAKPVHILTPSATVRRIVNMTALTVADANAAR